MSNMKVVSLPIGKIAFQEDFTRFQALEESNKDNFNRSLHELAMNIKAVGLLNPITVCEIAKGKYQVLAGNRRLAACAILGQKEIACNILSDANAFEVAFSENINREDLTDIEKGEWIEAAISYYLEQSEFKKLKKPIESIMAMLAAKLGRKQRMLYDWRKLAKTSTPEEKASVKSGKTKVTNLAKGKRKARVSSGETKTKKQNPLKDPGKFFGKVEKRFIKECNLIMVTLDTIGKHVKEFHQRKKTIAYFQKLQKAMSITGRYFAGVK